jgi:predicted amidophosphoribosyltransferase
MAMTKCWECEKEISDTADECPKCGADQDYSTEYAHKHPYRHYFSMFAFGVIALICMAPVMYAIIFFINIFLASFLKS